MRRHPALIPFSHHHHRALVAARRALVAGGGEGDLLAAAREFVVFFEGRAVRHFRDEEERLFPLLLECGRAEPPEALVRALLDHARLHALTARLRAGLAVGDVGGETLRRVGALLAEHVRLEERELFPLIELHAAARLEQALAAVPVAPPRPVEGAVVELARAAPGGGPLWGMQSHELEATLLVVPAGDAVAEHRNDECDILLVALEGSAAVRIDGADHELFEDELILLRRGSTRSLEAGTDGVRYLSIHCRRSPFVPPARLPAAPESAS